MTIAPTGRHEARDGNDYLVYTRRFAAPIEDVWAAVTDPERLSRWIGTWEGDPESGEITFFMTAEGEDVPGETYRIETCDPPRRLVTRAPAPSGAPDDKWRLELDLDDDEGFTTLTFSQAMSDAETASSVGPGWDYYLDRLVAAERNDDLDGIVFDRYLADQAEYYRAAFSEPSSERTERPLMGWEVCAILGLIVLVGAFLQGSTGIGFALLVAPVAGLIDPLLLPVTVLILMLPLNVMVAWRERASIDLRGASWISAARVASTPLGVWLLLTVPEHQLGFLIGGVTVLAAMISLVAPAFNPNRPALLVAGAVTGVSETASGIGGPPYALVYQHRPAPELRATVALCFLVGEVVSLIGLAIGGRLAGPGLAASLWLLPVVVAGTWMSSRVHRRVGGQGLRIAILVFAVVSGAMVMLRAL